MLANCASNVDADTHPETRSRCRVRKLDWTDNTPCSNRTDEADEELPGGAYEEVAGSIPGSPGGRGSGRCGGIGCRSKSAAGKNPEQKRGKKGDDGDDDDDEDDNTNLGAFEWTRRDVDELERNCELIFAADCVYDDALTDAFFEVLAKLLRRKRRRRDEVSQPGGDNSTSCEANAAAAAEKNTKTMRQPPRAMCAMERSVNFGVKFEAPRAHAFERFLLHLGLKPGGGGEGGGGGGRAVDVRLAPLAEVPAASRGVFAGRRVDLFEVPQRVMYDRVSELELWEVTLSDAEEQSENEKEEEA